MKIELYNFEKDFFYIHLFFALICIIVLLIPIRIGIQLLFLVFIYNLIIPLMGKIRDHPIWLEIWSFCFLISIFQVFPDWFLSAELNILVFPEDGLFKIGNVSAYMIGLWTIPLFIIIYAGVRVKERISMMKSYIIVAFLSFLIFTVAEATIWLIGSWYPQNVFLLFDHLALYIIFPEIFLGITSYFAFLFIQKKSHSFKILTAFLIMLLYLGGCCFFYFLIEKIILP